MVHSARRACNPAGKKVAGDLYFSPRNSSKECPDLMYSKGTCLTTRHIYFMFSDGLSQQEQLKSTHINQTVQIFNMSMICLSLKGLLG